MDLIKRLVVALADKAGYSVIPNWRRERLNFAEHLAALFEQERIDCVLDVGANIGQYAQFLRREVGYSGIVLSFEPVKQNLARLREAASGDPAWRVYGYGLSDRSGQLAINVMAASVFSSFLEPSPAQPAICAAMNSVVAREMVEVRRLDDVIEDLRKDHGFSRAYLKMDTQGHDLIALQGARQSLRHIAALQSEISVVPIYSGMPDYVTSLRTFEAVGFAVSNIFAVGLLDLRALEFDCVMVRSQPVP